MSLADQIIENGPYDQDLLVGPGFAGPLRWLRADALNELRDELIRLRAPLNGDPCTRVGLHNCAGRT